MKQGIVVCTWSGGQNWADLCLDSLRPVYEHYPFYVVMNDAKNADPQWVNDLAKFFNVILLDGDTRELGAMKAIVDSTDLDEFWFFQDTVEITDPSFIFQTFKECSGIDTSYNKNHMQYYLGMWDANVLRKMEIPIPRNKQDAIDYEWRFGNAYAISKGGTNGPIWIGIDPTFNHLSEESNYLSMMFGEERLSVVGKYLIKRVSLAPENMIWINGKPFTEDDIKYWKTKWKRK